MERPFPEDSPDRRRIYNRLITDVAHEFPGQVSIIDLGAILSPQGRVHRIPRRSAGPDARRRAHPVYAPGNVFVNNATQAVADAFYNWLSPKIWPSIIASSRPAG